MLNFLFRGLTAEPDRGAALFAALTAKAREPHWYIDGGVPDSIDGRFAMLATLTALALVRLEQAGEHGNVASVALTERFIEVMESEHRELGLGDPKLGQTIRKLVGSLARRTELWRSTIADGNWDKAARASLYKDEVAPGALAHSSQALRGFWDAIERTEFAALAEGRLR